MNYLIGSIKHCTKDRIEPWVKSATKHTSAQIVLLVLDSEIPKDIEEFSHVGVELHHYPTKNTHDVNICKWERHIKVRDFLKKLNDDDVVLLTDTLDIIFQKDPFEWYKNNAKKDLILTSEGIIHNNEPWNMRSILTDHSEFLEEVKHEEVINSGIILGKPKLVSDLLLYTYLATKGLNPESADQPALNVILQSNLIKNNCQIINSNDNFAIHCAVAGPTEQFKSWGFDKNYKYGIPILENNEILNSSTNESFYLIHQYNRIKEWDKFFKEKYKDVILPKKNINVKTAIVVCTKSNSSYHNDWKSSLRFDNDDYMLCDLSLDTPPPSDIILDFIPDNVVAYNEKELRQNFNFYLSLNNEHWWNKGGGRNIIWFYPHFRMMYFYQKNPNYDYYWFFDDDVTFPDNQLYDFINQHKYLEHDCMVTYIFGNINQTLQPDTWDMDEKMVAYHSTEHNWLTHYPGPGDNHPKEIKETYGSYFPLVRLSNKALNTLYEEHNKGYYGYSEGYVPTILNHYGLTLYSIYDKESNVKIDKNLIVHHRRYHQMTWENL
jgi:hypothetical protein